MVEGELKQFLDTFSSSNDFDSGCFIQLYQDTNAETVLKILARFHETLGASMEQTKQAMLSDDAEKIWKSSHKVAGSSELLGFKSYGSTARELSEQVRANPEISCHTTEIEDFMSMTEEIKDKIETILPNLSNYLF